MNCVSEVMLLGTDLGLYTDSHQLFVIVVIKLLSCVLIAWYVNIVYCCS